MKPSKKWIGAALALGAALNLLAVGITLFHKKKKKPLLSEGTEPTEETTPQQEGEPEEGLTHE